jgi:single-strand DNA-binding protein
MSTKSLNKVMLIGNLTRDPELRYTPSGAAVCTFSLATNRNWNDASGQKQEDTQFHRAVAWGKLGEICAELLHKGRKVYIQGRLQTRNWETKEGQERQTTEVVVDEMIALGAPKGGFAGNEGEYDQEVKTEKPAQNEAQEVFNPDGDVVKTKSKPTVNKPSKDTTVDDINDDIPF